MAIVDNNGKVYSSGPGYAGFLLSWRLLRLWLEAVVPAQQGVLRRIVNK